MLFSYICEKSWYTREGNRITRPPQINVSSVQFLYYEIQTQDNTGLLEELEAWVAETRGKSNQCKEWSVKILHTRVGVAEALKNIDFVREFREVQEKKVFEESLFIDRVLEEGNLGGSIFTECVFKGCRFECKNDRIKFRHCYFVDCNFGGVSSEMKFFSCQIVKSSSRSELTQSFVLNHCFISELSIDVKQVNL